ncbi:unnamed protein product [Clonostachys byssicola]|uniref:Uncharacterized protein n=1 Tax=Clonostachys byssicola TaxID=160290 RepID=A0A9N9UUC6_9HYPO|nr:unnamed protein product [Clonostachys byssicola]
MSGLGDHYSHCVLPSGVGTKSRVEDCNTQLLILIPLIVSHFASIASHIVLGIRPVRNRIRFWDRFYLNNSPKLAGPWSPWGSLASVAFNVVQAVAMALLLRWGGLDISIGAVTLLYLTRPRVGWVVVLLSSFLYESLTDTATDILFQECIQGLIAVPSAVASLSVTGLGQIPDGCNRAESSTAHSYLYEAGSFLMGGSTGLIVSAAFFLGIAIAMIWTRKFLRHYFGLMAMVPCIGAFISAWLLWIDIAYATYDGHFCPSNSVLGPMSAVTLAVPLITAVVRSWIGYPGSNYK